MARPTRTPAGIKVDRAEMVRMLRKGYTQAAIAEKLGVSQSQVAYDWRAVHDELKLNRNRDYDHIVAARLEQYSEVVRQAWEEWDRSKEAREDDSVMEAIAFVREALVSCGGLTAEASKALKVLLKSAKRGGEPDDKWLRTILTALDSMCDLEGVAEPKRKDMSGPDDAESSEKFLEFILPHVKRAMELTKKTPADLTPALPPATVVQSPEALPVETPVEDAPMAEEFDLEEYLKNRKVDDAQ